MQKHLALVLSLLAIGNHWLTATAQVALSIETAAKVQFNSHVGKTYQVYSTTNVDRTGWSALGSPQNGSGDAITFFHTTTSDQRVFFKVQETQGTVSPGGTPLVLVERARLNLLGQNLSDLILTNLDLTGFSFQNANLENADLSGSKFTDATLGGANFTHATLVGANLSGGIGSATFFGADLRNAILGGPGGTFENANLSGAKVGTQPLSYPLGGDFHNAIARGLIATNANISIARTDGADFTGSDFSGAQVSSFASFAGANLTGAKFINTNFSFEPGPTVRPVPFDNADLTDADLTGAKNFFDAPGIIYKNTKMPGGSIRSNP